MRCSPTRPRTRTAATRCAAWPRVAAGDALFYLPLARWWSRRQAETAELRADRAAVGYAGCGAVAGALLAVQDAPAAAAHGSATGARVVQLLGDDLPARSPSAAAVIGSGAGLIAAVWLAMCLGQAGSPGPAWRNRPRPPAP